MRTRFVGGIGRIAKTTDSIQRLNWWAVSVYRADNHYSVRRLRSIIGIGAGVLKVITSRLDYEGSGITDPRCSNIRKLLPNCSRRAKIGTIGRDVDDANCSAVHPTG